MIIEIPNENSIVKWKNDDKDEWKVAEISDLIKAYESPKVTVFAENASKEEIEDFKQELENVLERPQGKWVEVEKQGKTGDGRIFTYTIVVCSKCGEQYDLEGEKFCPNCGANMEGKADQLRDCENCVHHSDNGCEVWECEFEKRSDV